MTWPDELAALGTGGVLTALLYWLGRRVATRLEDLLKQIQQRLEAILAKLDDQERRTRSPK